jgi:hypothetical protein
MVQFDQHLGQVEPHAGAGTGVVRIHLDETVEYTADPSLLDTASGIEDAYLDILPDI